MADAKIYHGACLCAKVKFEIQGEPFQYDVCNCQNCKQASGSAFSSHAFFNSSQIKITQGKDNITHYTDENTKSGKPLTRSFCTSCGARLFVKPQREGVILAHPSVVGDSDWVPKVESFPDERLAWVKKINFDT